MITLNGNSRFVAAALGSDNSRPVLSSCVGVQIVNGKPMLGATDGYRLHYVSTDLTVGTYTIHPTKDDAILTPSEERFPNFAAIVPVETARTRLYLAADNAITAQSHTKALAKANLHAVLTAHHGTLHFLGYMDLAHIDREHPLLIAIDPTFLASALSTMAKPIYASLDKDRPTQRPMTLTDDMDRRAVIMPRLVGHGLRSGPSDYTFTLSWNA